MTRIFTAQQLLKHREVSIQRLANGPALDHIGVLIDQSNYAHCRKSIERSIRQLNELDKRDLIPEYAVLSQYFRANAYSALARINHGEQSIIWSCPEIQLEMLALSRAATHEGFASTEPMRQCQILTNYGNLLKNVGRLIDAIAQWDKALRIEPNLGKARGSRGIGLKQYAALQQDQWHQAILGQHAYDALLSASAPEAYYESGDGVQSNAIFLAHANQLKNHLRIDEIRAKNYLEQGELGRSKAARAYRAWCLKNQLFLNPLNDLGRHVAAAYDELRLPPLSEKVSDRQYSTLPPPIFGFFNQLKQEYASARFMLYEGIASKGVHFSDRKVEISNTQDFSELSLATERIRTAFRITYSLLDKIAVLINGYMKFDLDENRDKKFLSFKNVWFTANNKNLNPRLLQSKNKALSGLYWLSQELHDNELKLTTAADASELHDIRNALEHSYLRVQEGWAAPFEENLTYTIGSHVLESKAVRVMQLARSALFNLTFAIDFEETLKSSTSTAQFKVSINIPTMKDSRKRRYHD